MSESNLASPPLTVFTEHDLLQFIEDSTQRFGHLSIQKIDPNTFRVTFGGRACEGESLRECLNKLKRAEK